MKFRFRRRSKRIPWLRAVVGLIGVWVVLDLLSLPAGDEFLRRNPSSTALMDARREESQERGQHLALRHAWVPLREMPTALLKAIILAEDTNFYSHHGFDLGELFHSIQSAISSFSFPRGASTITQQLAKNLYLSESRNPLRKLREGVLTIKLESSLSKQRILELYLNLIELGPGVFGVEAAAQYYFKVSARDLSPTQSAFIAAVIPNPRTVYNPNLHPERVRKRSALILRRMQASRIQVYR